MRCSCKRSPRLAGWKVKLLHAVEHACDRTSEPETDIPARLHFKERIRQHGRFADSGKVLLKEIRLSLPDLHMNRSSDR